MAEIKVTEITLSGEQIQYIYDGNDKKECLANCVVMFYFHNKNCCSQAFKNKKSKVMSQLVTTPHFIIWGDIKTNTHFCTRI